MSGSEVQELGRVLREARERKGVTLANAQQATKIRQSFLQALENEDFSVLPPPFYIRGFIKTYAAYLNLNPGHTVQIFDELMDYQVTSRVSEPAELPSADSGGRGVTFPLHGLSQGEAKLVEASNEKLNLAALPTPTAPASGSYKAPYSPSDGSGEYGTPLPVYQRNLNGVPGADKYVLKRVMLDTTRGPFYMPNFVPAILVSIIVIAACLLVYRGIAAQPKETSEASTSATVGSASSSGSNRLTPGATQSSRSNFTPPPFYTPDRAIEALGNPRSTAPVLGQALGQGGALPQTEPSTPAPPPPTATATPVPSPTPLPPPIKVEVGVTQADPKGSWLTIWVDDKQQVAKIIPPGETLTFEGRKIAVRAGNPGVVTIKVNGEPREYTKPQTGVITHIWFADGRDVIEY